MPTSTVSFKRLNGSVWGNVVAGVIAATIYIVIALATAAPVGSSVRFGLVLGIFTFAASFVVTRVIVGGMRHRAA